MYRVGSSGASFQCIGWVQWRVVRCIGWVQWRVVSVYRVGSSGASFQCIGWVQWRVVSVYRVGTVARRFSV